MANKMDAVEKRLRSTGCLNILQNAILVGLGVESLKAKIELEEWQNVAVAYDRDTHKFTVTISM